MSSNISAILICPDDTMRAGIQQALAELPGVRIARVLPHYPADVELIRILRAVAPQMLFISTESKEALSIVTGCRKLAHDIQVVAICKELDGTQLVPLMRVGIRHCLAPPFSLADVSDVLSHVAQDLEETPPVYESADRLFSFMPAKAGVGASTIAMNTAVALSKRERTLLADMDLSSGLIRFMMGLPDAAGVTYALQRMEELDHVLWKQLVLTSGTLDVIHAGKINPSYRIDPVKVHEFTSFLRRHYECICCDLSGNLERYSLEVLKESRQVLLVCTPELGTIHLAREKLVYLRGMGVADRVQIVLNRAKTDDMLTEAEIADTLGAPILTTLPNDYESATAALKIGATVDSATPLGRGLARLATALGGPAPVAAEESIEQKQWSIKPSRMLRLALGRH
jgi:pilus assembly protein CpaE